MGVTGRDSTDAAGRPSRPQRRRWIIAAALVAVLLVAGVGGYALLRSPTSAWLPVYHAQVRQYYIAADPIVWNYTPSGTNELTGVPLGSKTKDLYVEPGPIHPLTYVNGTYPMETFLKCAYQGYTDGTFSTLLARPSSQAYLGIAGPVIYAAVGDTVRVEFRNSCPFTTSLSAPGVGANDSGTGPNSNGFSVAPGATWNYSWPIPASAGPGPSGPGSVMWMYSDGAAPLNGTDTGLFGAIIVSSPADANPNGTPADVAANVVLLLGQMDESQSPYFAYNLAHYVPDDYALNSSYVRYAINGFNFGNLPMVTLTEGEHVRWYVGDIGAASVVPSWWGNTLVEGGANVAAVGLAAGASVGLDMWTNNSGVWLVDSAVPGDLTGGMEARYTVLPEVTTRTTAASGGSSDFVGSCLAAVLASARWFP
jgi:manganese oxidase